MQTGTLSNALIDSWVKNEVLYSKSAGKRKVGAPVDVAADVAAGLQLGKAAMFSSPPTAPAALSSRKRNTSRSRSASAAPSPTPLFKSSPIARGGAADISVVVAAKAPKKVVKPKVASEVVKGPSSSDAPADVVEVANPTSDVAMAVDPPSGKVTVVKDADVVMGVEGAAGPSKAKVADVVQDPDVGIAGPSSSKAPLVFPAPPESSGSDSSDESSSSESSSSEEE